MKTYEQFVNEGLSLADYKLIKDVFAIAYKKAIEHLIEFHEKITEDHILEYIDFYMNTNYGVSFLHTKESYKYIKNLVHKKLLKSKKSKYLKEHVSLDFPIDENDREGKAIIRDEFLINVYPYLRNEEDRDYLKHLDDQTTYDEKIYSNSLKGEIATRLRYDDVFSTLTYNFEDKKLMFRFPTYQLISPENYEYLRSMKKYNL